MKAKIVRWSVVALLLLAAHRPAMAQQNSGAKVTTSGEVSSDQTGAARQVELEALPQLAPQDLQTLLPSPAPRTGLTPEEYSALKDQVSQQSASTRSATAPPPALPPDSLLTPSASVGFTGQDLSFCGAIPSDMALAVGTTFVVQVNNTCIAVFSKNGTLQAGFPKSLDAFLGLPASAFPFDPRALYDWVNNRFIVVVDRFANNVGTITVAASQTSDPRGGWNIYQLGIPGGGSILGDYPTLGQDRQALYVSMNRFQGNLFIDAAVLLLPKQQIYAGQGFTYNVLSNLRVGNTTVDSVQPANVMNKADQPRAEFMVNSFNINFGGGMCRNGCNGLVIWAVANPLRVAGSPGPELSGVGIATAHNYSIPPNARQPGCASGSCLLDTGDTRISGGVHYSAGSLWGALETAGSAGNVGATLLWFQLRPFLNDGNNARCAGAFTNLCADIISAGRLNEDCFFCAGRGAHASNYYGTLQPDPEGNVTLVYNYSDDNTFPGTVYNSRRVTGQKNTMHDGGIFLLVGQGFYQQLDEAGRNRWGDYTATAPDLTKSFFPSMWFSGQYAKSNNSWGTVIGKNGFTGPNQP